MNKIYARIILQFMHDNPKIDITAKSFCDGNKKYKELCRKIESQLNGESLKPRKLLSLLKFPERLPLMVDVELDKELETMVEGDFYRLPSLKAD